jgi:hypothetical protein
MKNTVARFLRLALLCSVASAAWIVSPLIAQAACALSPSGIVSWWQAEGNALDIAGTNNGTFTNPKYAVGEVGQAFNFDGSGNNVRVPASPTLDVGAGAGMTIEGWIFSPDSSSGRPIAEWVPNGPGTFGTHFYVHLPGPGVLYANLFDTLGQSHIIETTNGAVQINAFQHVAVAYDKASGLARLLVNGTVVTETNLGTFTPQTSPDLSIGLRPSSVPFGPIPFVGRIDELSLYSRALAPTEIKAIYDAGNAGKCPQGVFILQQPANQNAIVGSNVTFSVEANGVPPLFYQWIMDGTNLPGATGQSLVLTNVQYAQAGTYAVEVTNNAGSIVSSNATLTVSAPPACATPPSGLVSWWPGEGNANDNEGANNGVFTNALYGPGEVGEAFSFNGSGNYVRVPASVSLNVGAGTGMTIETWINPQDLAGRPIAEWVPKTPGNFGAHFYANLPNQGALYANLYDVSNRSHIIETTNGVLQTNVYQHVAVTYDKASGIAALFVNGTVFVQTNLGTFTPQTSPDLSIGYRPSSVPAGPIAFLGKIDELSVYARALTTPEVQAIHSAGISGKCDVPVGASIFSQPSNQTVTVGQTATFQIQAGGTSPLSYQWLYDGTNAIADATNATLVLTNVQMSQAGSYSVVVTNAYGSATSSNATLVVNFPPATVRIVGASGTAGQAVTVPVVLVANGNENAVGFSVDYSPTLLTNAGAVVGSGAPGASFVVNPNQAGQIGIGVALPSGTTFAPGTQEVARISFVAAASSTNFNANLTFGDVPTKRLISDAKANPLPANFAGGQVALVRSQFEADVAPRPNGDGQVDIADWVQVGRFVAALDSPTNSSEFQRADCAPRDTVGDGQLTVSDWVQAGRYAAGLDPLTVAGGPTNPPPGGIAVRPLHKDGSSPPDVLSVQGPIIFQGQTGTAIINLMAQGGENAVGFSLAFDPTVVTYISTSAGSDAVNSTMDINPNYATNGQIGIILALRTDVGFTPGTRQLVKVNFQALSAGSVNSIVSLTDTPVKRDVSDTNAISVATTYANGIISINPKPTLAIAHSNQNISLAWPLWATNYNLQQALTTALPISNWTNLPVSPVLTNNSLSVTLPLTSSLHFYRLQHQ